MAFTPAFINSSIPSGKGKKASEAATESIIFSGKNRKDKDVKRRKHRGRN